MKINIHIFTFYLLALSLVPCGDGGGGILEIANHFLGIEHQHVSNHEEHSSGCGDDTCTPFCICNCCSISVNVPTNINYNDKHIMLISSKLLLYNPNFYPSGFLSAVWHPPTFS